MSEQDFLWRTEKQAINALFRRRKRSEISTRHGFGSGHDGGAVRIGAKSLTCLVVMERVVRVVVVEDIDALAERALGCQLDQIGLISMRRLAVFLIPLSIHAVFFLLRF